ncbi:molybdate ABC transporter substrate-binding protein [Aquabacterium sp.]|uniref:molybdate ABC transporter substrate-binding protein n=1 Tax=Aquabacterium sp. TaxID=1872578 RepID=UPI003BF564C7
MRRIRPSAFIGAALVCLSTLVQAGEFTVSAAASLTNAFKEMAQGFAQQNPGSKVLLNFGASGALLQQIAKGAPVDVFASADEESMDQAEKQGLILTSGRRKFARNTLVVVTPAESAVRLGSLKDLTAPQIRRIAIGNPGSVPVGRYTQRALASAKLWPTLQVKAVNTQNVRQSLDYVARGEVDAGFVYATDAAIMKDKVTVAFSVPIQEAIHYPIAPIAGSLHADDARRFVAYVLSPVGQQTLAKYGFLKP